MAIVILDNTFEFSNSVTLTNVIVIELFGQSKKILISLLTSFHAVLLKFDLSQSNIIKRSKL